jgi:ABC-type antimicrobial peptide transport system permease subunit
MFLGAGDPTRDWGVYLPLEQRAPAGMSIVIRANGAPGPLADWMRRTVASIDPGLPVGSAFVMKDVIFQETWQTRLFGTLFASFGAIALFLAVVGLYGVVAFSTRQRTREIGVRVALGAQPAGVVALIVRQGFWQLLVGSVFGIAGGLALTRALVPIDIGVRVFDPVPHGTVLVLLAAATLVAHLVPALRAARTTPATVLRG